MVLKTPSAPLRRDERHLQALMSLLLAHALSYAHIPPDSGSGRRRSKHRAKWKWRSTMTAEQRLAELGISLPEVPKPRWAYAPAVRSGYLVFVSGQIATEA